MKILITGATGLIGQQLGIALAREQHELYIVTRSQERAKKNCPYPCHFIEGDLGQSPISLSKDVYFDAVINLMGEPIAQGRWTTEKKKRLRSSRVEATTNLWKTLKQCSHAPKVFISTSAIGIYGSRGDELLSETSKPGRDFLSQLCEDWEAAAINSPYKTEGTRVVLPRVGIVLSREGGMLQEVLPIFKNGLGGVLGSGSQWMSWIHINDVVQFYKQALTEPNWSGPFNLVSPHPVTNSEFTKILGSSLNTITLLPAPAFGLKFAFGEKSQILLGSQKISTRLFNDQSHSQNQTELQSESQLQSESESHSHSQSHSQSHSKFQFQFSKLKEALDYELSFDKKGEEVFISRQFIDLPLEKIFPFFSEAKNLEKITPSSLSFKILSVSTPQIQENTLIDYSLKIHGVPVHWKTQIEQWNPPYQFVDNQLQGPYALWHHTHSFEKLGSGTLMTDRVRYKLPLGFLGRVGGLWFVKKEVQGIFNHRYHVVSNYDFTK